MAAAARPPKTFPYDHLFKILIIGDAGVGKSSMLLRFTDDSFDEHIQSTIGVDFKVKHLDVNEKRVKLTIWDTAGQERFRTLTSSYYRGAHGVVLVYDVTRTDTFENLQQWLKEVNMYSPNNGEAVVKLLVGNKIDLVDGSSSSSTTNNNNTNNTNMPEDGSTRSRKMVDRDVAEEWARDQGMLFLEASAKTKLGIRQVFLEVVQKILEDPDLLANTVPGKPKIQLKPQGGVGGNGAGGMMEDDGGMCC
jgi:Ras-related protein Rab-18